MNDAEKWFEESIINLIRNGWKFQSRYSSREEYEIKIKTIILNSLGMKSDEHLRWVADNAEHLRFEFSLNKDSLIIDAGGYDGKWAEEMFRRYKCNIFIFEPVESFFENICDKFEGNEKISSFNVGLSDDYKNQKIYLNEDATSIHHHNENSEDIILIDFNEFIEKKKITKIDLMKINIEGGEYPLLMSIIKEMNHTRIKNILVQFHIFPEYFDSYREAIENELKKTHDLVFRYDFIWEHWRIKNK